MKDIRWKQRFQNFQFALNSLIEAVESNDTFSDLEKDGVIQRFEFTFELAWKVLQDYFHDQGYKDVNGPRNVIKKAFQDNILKNGHLWVKILEDRNLMAHTYDKKTSRDIFEKIMGDYYDAMIELNESLQKIYGN